MQVSHGELIILHWEELERANYGRMSLDSRRGREGRLFFFLQQFVYPTSIVAIVISR